MKTCWIPSSHGAFFTGSAAARKPTERIYRNLLLEKDPRGKLIKREDIFRAVELIEEARRDLIMNVNYNYALKNLMLKIGG